MQPTPLIKITASQVGNASYSAATPVTRSFTVAQATQDFIYIRLPTGSSFPYGTQVSAAGEDLAQELRPRE